MTESLVFAPLVDLRLIWGLMALAMALLGFALWKGLRGWPFRALGFAVLALGLANPSLQIEDRKPLNDIVLLLVDESASQGLAARPAQSAEAVARMGEEALARGLKPPLSYSKIVRFVERLGNMLRMKPRLGLAGGQLRGNQRVGNLHGSHPGKTGLVFP